MSNLNFKTQGFYTVHVLLHVLEYYIEEGKNLILMSTYPGVFFVFIYPAVKFLPWLSLTLTLTLTFSYLGSKLLGI